MHHEPNEMPRSVGVTALIVAQSRAAESRRPDRLFDDPFATDFVLQAGPAFTSTSAEMAPILALRGNGQYFAIRTRFFDDCLLDACRAGCRQVVLLGAGLDTRAFRLTWLNGVSLFELDLPDVLAFKERVLAGRSATPKCQRIAVRVDLRDDWPSTLVAAGFLPSKPTAWLLEGILMYFDEDERDELLERVGDLSAAGSRLAIEQRGAPGDDHPTSTTDISTTDLEDLDEQVKRAGETVIARLNVKTPVEQPDPSMADLETWLARHEWRARVYSAAERFQFHGRPVPRPLEAGAVQLWLAYGERVQTRLP